MQQTHCVEIEAQEDGSYNLVPEQIAELGVETGLALGAMSQAIAPQPSGIIYVCRVTHAYGIDEETRLLSDGTFLQVITERSGATYRNTGSWSKQWSGPFWDATLGNEVLLKHWADPLEVVLKASTVEIERRETLLPAHAFQPQVNWCIMAHCSNGIELAP